VLVAPVVAAAEVELAARRDLRDRECRDPEHDPLERGGDGAGVGDVVAEVGAQVDARHDQLGLGVEQPERGESHAVDGRPVGRVSDRSVAEVVLLDRERLPGRDAARRRAAVRVGGDHGQVHVGHLEQGAPRGVQADRLDPVVVREENLHRRGSG
jgi:hypothetical protein